MLSISSIKSMLADEKHFILETLNSIKKKLLNTIITRETSVGFQRSDLPQQGTILKTE
jgi:hypothetical protein